jgi:hypothetical protein
MPINVHMRSRTGSTTFMALPSAWLSWTADWIGPGERVTTWIILDV